MQLISIFAPVAALALVATTGGAFKDKQVLKDIEKVKEIKDKAEYIKDSIAIANMYDKKSIIESENVIIQNSISPLIVPSTTHGKYDELLLDTYYIAIQEWFSTQNNTDTPTCTELSTATLMNIDDCNYILTKNFEFYSYNDQNVSYTIPKELALKLPNTSYLQTVENPIDINQTIVSDSRQYKESMGLDNKILSQTFDINKKIIELVQTGDVNLSKTLNKRLYSFNPSAAQKNIILYGW